MSVIFADISREKSLTEKKNTYLFNRSEFTFLAKICDVPSGCISVCIKCNCAILFL